MRFATLLHRANACVRIWYLEAATQQGSSPRYYNKDIIFVGNELTLPPPSQVPSEKLETRQLVNSAKATNNQSLNSRQI